jgi:voltage-gated potassium channel
MRESGAPTLVRLLASRFRLPILLLVAALLYGTIGFWVIERFDPLDSLYMTVTTLSTVGFGEIEPLSPAGRVFTMTLIVFGVIAVFDLVGGFTTLLAGGELGQSWRRRDMRRRIGILEGHYVICAYGRVGHAAAEELRRRHGDILVIEANADLEEDLSHSGMTYLIGDPSKEGVLEDAGVERAKGLICAVDSDAINVYITLTARSLNPDLFIISRASSPSSVQTLYRAGADRVVSPYTLSGTRMASMAMDPAVLEFVDMVGLAPGLRVEELRIGPDSEMCGLSVRDACTPFERVMVLAVKKPDGELLIPPQAHTPLEVDDVLIAIGPVSSLSEFASSAL